MGIFFIVFFALHMWGAQQGITKVYPGSFFSYIWEPTANTIHHPSVSIELEPKLTELGKDVWLMLKFVIGGIVAILIFSFFRKNTNKKDWEVISTGTLIIVLFFAGLVIAGLISLLRTDWKVVRLLHSMGPKWKLITGGFFCLIIFLIYFRFRYRNQLHNFWSSGEDEITH